MKLLKDSYKGLTEGNPDFMDGKEMVIKKAHSQAQMMAVKQLLKEDDNLRNEWVNTRKQAGSALTGHPVLPF